jgi:MoxR-like ATPase
MKGYGYMLEPQTIAHTSAIEQIKNESIQFFSIAQEVSKVIVGQQEIIDFILISILCNGHILLEGVPGVAKTTIIKAITKVLGLHFNRIQFTPDLLPADLIGTLIYNQKNHEFETKKGPIFANLILADEINRAPAKVQSALLEAMQEQQVTIGSTTFALPDPFLVFATQNPIEQEGTYRLPEAQIDRFMFKLNVTYPSRLEEQELLLRNLDVETLLPRLTATHIKQAQQLVRSMYLDNRVRDYIVDIVRATREPAKHAQLADLAGYIECGSSPRGSLALKYASMAHAFLKQRHFVTPDDVKKVATKVLGHRIALSYQAEAEKISQEQIIQKIINAIACP